MTSADLSMAWEEHGQEWVAWARTPDHDSYWRFHRDQFLALLPPPGRCTLDLGCGEGRLSRELQGLGHRVTGVDASLTILTAAREHSDGIDYLLADARALPFADGQFDCVVAFMSLQDIDDLEHAVREAARVLADGGRLCIAIVHPVNSAGSFHGDGANAPFVIEGSYLGESYYADKIARGGLEMTFVSAHRPLQTYTDALSAAGLLIEQIREPAIPDHSVRRETSRRWQRVPLFLHIRTVKPSDTAAQA